MTLDDSEDDDDDDDDNDRVNQYLPDENGIVWEHVDLEMDDEVDRLNGSTCIFVLGSQFSSGPIILVYHWMSCPFRIIIELRY